MRMNLSVRFDYGPIVPLGAFAGMESVGDRRTRHDPLPRRRADGGERHDRIAFAPQPKSFLLENRPIIVVPPTISPEELAFPTGFELEFSLHRARQCRTFCPNWA